MIYSSTEKENYIYIINQRGPPLIKNYDYDWNKLRYQQNGNGR